VQVFQKFLCDGLLQVDAVNLNKSKDLSHQKVLF
jgi:hypothetical protein